MLASLQRSVSIDVRRATPGAGAVALALAVALAPRPATAPSSAQGDFAGDYANLPLSFVPNSGQADPRVRYYAQAPGFSAYFTRRGVTMAVSKGREGKAIELQFVGANAAASINGTARRAGTVNYLSRSERHTSVPTYGRIEYRNLWPGIDLVFAGDRGRPKYEFHVAPGASPADVRLAYAGIETLSVAGNGSFAVQTRNGTLRDAAPRALPGEKRPSRVISGSAGSARMASRWVTTTSAGHS